VNKRKCRGCKEFWRPEPGTPSYVRWCSDDCREKMALAELAKVKRKNLARIKKAKQETRKKHAKHKREFYENDKATRRKAAVEIFNRFIRLRDHNQPCISCGKPSINRKPRSFDAGHYIPAGGGVTSSALRFCEENVNLQCHWFCNIQQSGNRTEYRKGLIRKYGEQVVDSLEGPQPKVKTSVEYYRNIERLYKQKIAELEKFHMEQDNF